jgi:protein disulfide-isomerase A6
LQWCGHCKSLVPA